VKLSILIVNWNSRDHLRRCLATIEATCVELCPQIVVVDGASFDGCGEMLAADFPSVDFVQSRENLGFGGSNNLGFKKVQGEFVLLLNPDTELKPGAVACLLEQFAALPDAGLLGPRLLNSDGSLQTSCVQSFPTPINQFLDSDSLRRVFPKSSLWGVGTAFSSASPSEVEAVSGACMLLRSSTFRDLIGFGSEYFFYGEDMDLCARIRAGGGKIYHVPAAEVLHHGGVSTTGQFSKFSTVHLRQSVFLFIRKHQGRMRAELYRSLMACSALIRITVLLPLFVLSALRIARPGGNGVKKWTAVLRWSLGLEAWVSRPALTKAVASTPRTAC
jgi:GT2 family glycosyltransferase